MADRPHPAAGAAATSRRSLAIGIAAGILGLLVFTAISLRLAEDAVRHQAEARVRSSADLAARLVAEQSLRLDETVGAYAAQLRDVRPLRAAQVRGRRDRAQVRAVLRGVAGGGVDGVDSALLTDPLGRVAAVAPEGRIPLRTDLSGREWFRGVTRTHRAYVSRAYRSVAPGHPVITSVVVPVRARGGRAIGLLVASERARTQRFADTLGREVGATLTVTDQAGTIVARTGTIDRRLVSIARDALVADALRGRHGVTVRDVLGQRTVSGYAPVPGTGWTVTADVPASQAFSDVPKLRWYLVGGAAIVAFLVLWLIPLLVARLGRARDALVVSEAFQTDLLPTELPPGVRTHYVASERRMLLGGDFLDAVRTPDGGLAVCIGDVCGHGPRAAALGATLRAGWRTLATAGGGVDRLDLLDRLVESERRDPDLFVTVACASVPPSGDRIRFVVGGHPPPVLAANGAVIPLEGERGPALGLGAPPDRRRWPIGERTLEPGDWSLLLYTDGVIEARAGAEGARIGLDGLLAIAGDALRDGRLDPSALIARVAALSDAHEAADDMALLLVDGDALARGLAEGLATARAG